VETRQLTQKEKFTVTPFADDRILDSSSVLLVDFLEHVSTVNADDYCVTLRLATGHQNKTSRSS
jgi:hypothetical protein